MEALQRSAKAGDGVGSLEGAEGLSGAMLGILGLPYPARDAWVLVRSEAMGSNTLGVTSAMGVIGALILRNFVIPGMLGGSESHPHRLIHVLVL